MSSQLRVPWDSNKGALATDGSGQPSREQSLKLEMGQSQVPKISEIVRCTEWVIRSGRSRGDRAGVTSWRTPAARVWKLKEVGVGSVGEMLTCH